jgi:hypothetical protein
MASYWDYVNNNNDYWEDIDDIATQYKACSYCELCKKDTPYAESNTKDGKYYCWECRTHRKSDLKSVKWL